MKKITLLLFYREKERTLRALQKLGLVDLDIKVVDSDKLRRWRRQKQEFIKTMNTLRHLASKLKKSSLPAQKISLPPDRAKRLQFISQHLKERENLLAALAELQQQLKEALLWGDFDFAKIGELHQRGISLYLYSGSKKFFERYDFKDLPVAVVAREGGLVRFVVFSQLAQPPVIPFERHELPTRSIAEIRYEIDYLQKKLNEEEAILLQLAENLDELVRSVNHLDNRIVLEEARQSLASEAKGAVYVITGYFPAKQEAAARRLCDSKNLAYLLEEPTKQDPVPVKLANLAPFRLFEPIARLFSLPNYHEIDPTPFFAPFFTLFFGLCLGDVGYGLVVVLLAFFLLGKSKWRFWGGLLLLLGLSTVFSGILLNTFFGATLFSVSEQTGLLKGGEDLTWFASYTVQGKTVFPAMTLSLALGIVQLLLALLLQAANGIKRHGWLYSLKPLGMFSIVLATLVLAAHSNFLGLGFNADFVIGPLPVGQWLTSINPLEAQILLLVGLLCFFLFNNLKKKVFLRPFMGLWEFYQFTTGFLGDVLSYIRIFALGLAGGLLGNAFNQIAFMLLPYGESGIDFTSPLWLFSLFVLLLGHTLNLALSFLGAFVHPLRLTFVEFYKNMDFHGMGREYRPFRKYT